MNTRKLTTTAIFSAISVICVFCACTLPTLRLAFLALASCFCAVVSREFGARFGLFHFTVTALISFFIAPKCSELIAFIMFLGYYPIVRKSLKFIGFRYIVFVIALSISVMAFKNIIFEGLSFSLMHYVFGFVAMTVIFVIYDYALLQFMQYYELHIRSKIFNKK